MSYDLTLKRKIYILGIISIILVILLIISSLYIMLNPPFRAQDQREFYGTIVSYEDTDDGLTFILEDKRGVQYEFLVTDSTGFYTAGIENDIISQKIGITVNIGTEFWVQEINWEEIPQGLYPATLIVRIDG